MRVIAGLAGGLKLYTRRGEKTRPTSDKVKGALFNIIGPNISEKRFLDLFAGSGAIGIEALSRGATLSVFVDEDAVCIDNIRRNLKATVFMEKGKVLKYDVIKALGYLFREGQSFDYIFLDPPYKAEVITKVLEVLKEKPLLAKKGCIIIEHHIKNAGWVSAGFELSRQKFYGDTVLSFLREQEVE